MVQCQINYDKPMTRCPSIGDSAESPCFYSIRHGGQTGFARPRALNAPDTLQDSPKQKRPRSKPEPLLQTLRVWLAYMSSSRRVGSSIASFTRTRKVTASRPSMMRWS